MIDFTSTAAPRADFPEEIVYHDGFLGWGLVGFVVAIGVIALFFLYRYGYARALRQGALAIDENLKSLRRPVTHAARARPDELLEKARLASEAFDERFARTVALGAALNRHTKDLKTAVGGLKPAEDKEKPKSETAPVPATVTGSTVISINVAAPSTQTAGEAEPAKTPVREDQPIALWKAIQRLYEELHARQAFSVALKGALDQLMFAPKWERPREITGRRGHDL